jgi:hypothetical protein
MKSYQIMFNTKDGRINEAFCKQLENQGNLDVADALTAIERRFGIRPEEVEGISYYPMEPVVLM